MNKHICFLFFSAVFVFANGISAENSLNSYIQQLNGYEKQYINIKEKYNNDPVKLEALTQKLNKTLNSYKKTVNGIINKDVSSYKSVLKRNVKQISSLYANDTKMKAQQLLSPFNADLKYLKDNVNAVKNRYVFIINRLKQIKEIKQKMLNTLTAYKELKNYTGLVSNLKNVLSVKLAVPTSYPSSEDEKLEETYYEDASGALLNLEQINAVFENSYLIIDEEIFNIKKLSRILSLQIIQNSINAKENK